MQVVAPIEIHPVPVHEKHTLLHGLVGFSVLVNVLLAGAIYSIFQNDFYFRLWVLNDFLANLYPMAAIMVAAIGVFGLFVNVAIWLNGLRKHFIRIGERRTATRFGVEIQ